MASKQVQGENVPSSTVIIEPQVVETAQERAILGIKRGMKQRYGYNAPPIEEVSFGTPETTRTHVSESEFETFQKQAVESAKQAQQTEQAIDIVQAKPSLFGEMSQPLAIVLGSVLGGVASAIPYVAYEIGKDVVHLFSKKEEPKEEPKKEEEEKKEETKPTNIIFQPIIQQTQRSTSSVSLRPYQRRKRRQKK